MVFLYKNKIPSINDIVMVRVVEINKLNIETKLMDYNDMIGYISYSELCRKKKYNLHKLVNVGKDVIVQVIKINKELNYVELSIRSLVSSDIDNFNKTHRIYTNLYNLWRYVYMKLNPYINMNIKNIISDELNIFMENSFWKIQTIIEDNLNNETEDNNINIFEELYNKLINKTNNYSLLKYIEDFDPIKIKEFDMYSYEINGLNDIKNALNYKLFDKWEEITAKYDVEILYLTGGKYNLTIKQKEPMEDNIEDVYNLIIQEIKNKTENKNIIFNI